MHRTTAGEEVPNDLHTVGNVPRVVDDVEPAAAVDDLAECVDGPPRVPAHRSGPVVTEIAASAAAIVLVMTSPP